MPLGSSDLDTMPKLTMPSQNDEEKPQEEEEEPRVFALHRSDKPSFQVAVRHSQGVDLTRLQNFPPESSLPETPG